MKVWKDKDGKELTGKEFMQRWREGIEKTTPLQHTTITLVGYAIVMVGILWGMIMTSISGTWWLFTILLGSAVITIIQVIGTMQKYIILKNMEKL